MDIGPTIFSSMLCKSLFKIINQHDVKYQFGLSPGVGCQDVTFPIKNLLHTRHNHNLSSYVAFADMVKAFDTVNHQMMLKMLRQYGTPPKLYLEIARMCFDLKVLLSIGKAEEVTKQTVGVHQG